MVIKVYPEDLVKRCLWDNYVYYVVGSEKDAEKILKENVEFEISEKDAFVIGLLKVIETDNLMHKFNLYVVELLTNKSIKDKDLVLIKKKVFDVAVDKFLNKFPPYWVPDPLYKKGLDDLINYIKNLKEEISKLDIIKITDKNAVYEFYNSNSIKKLLKFNY